MPVSLTKRFAAVDAQVSSDEMQHETLMACHSGPPPIAYSSSKSQ